MGLNFIIDFVWQIPLLQDEKAMSARVTERTEAGATGGNRTHTSRGKRDFESRASTNFATMAEQIYKNCQSIFAKKVK